MIKEIQRFDFQGKTTFVKAVLEPPFKMMTDMYDEACFYFVKTGKRRMYSATEKIELVANEGVVLQCGKYINNYIASEEIVYCESIAVHLFPEVLRLVYDNEFPDFLTNIQTVESAGFERVESTSLLENYIQSLEFYFSNPSLVSDELLKLKIKELLLLLSKTDNVGIIKTLLAGMFDPLEINFKEVIEANIYNNLSVQDLAELTNLSLSSFKREFEKHFSSSPAKYIKRRKLEKATKLLKNTELRITDVAFDSGFNDLAHFSKSFQSEYGLAPSDYRDS